jgi:hypothetical protein
VELLDGAARFTVAGNSDPASSFVVRVPGADAQVMGTEFAFEIGAEANLSDLLVYSGKVEVTAGETKLEVTPEAEQKPVAATIEAAAIQPVEVREVLLARWQEWNDRQADALIDRYGLDIGEPEKVEPEALQEDAHPQWRAQIALRRARIVERARVLAEALGAEKLQATTEAKARFEAARTAWGQVVSAERHRIVAEMQATRREAWQARAEARDARHEELRGRLGEIRAAHAARGHGQGQGEEHGRSQ